MKALLTALSLAALLAAPSAEARERYVGTWQIISKTGTCPDYDPTGDRGQARYRPPITGTDNGSDTLIGLFYGDGARGLRVTGAVNVGATSVFKNAYSVNVFEGGDVVGPPTQQIRYISQSPASLTPTTVQIIILAEINNYDWQAGCKPRIRMLLQKRQDDLP